MKTTLGTKMRDVITGFEGTVTGRCEYISGCNQALLTPKVDGDGKLREGEWFDEQRLTTVDGSKVVLENGKNPGFDKPAPKRN